MDTLIVAVVSLVVGFIAGALVFRHNAAQVAAAQAAVEKAISDLKSKT